MTDLPVQRFHGRDGVQLAWRTVGSGRPLILLHGLMGSGAHLASEGLVTALAGHGYQVILPDLRGHGDSGKPHDPACYPRDVLIGDGLALLEHLRLDDYDLAGYSLGGKLVLRLLARGARPSRAIVGGQGLDALDAESNRTGGYRRVLAAMASGSAFEPGSPDEAFAGWITQVGVDPRAIGYLLDSFVPTPREALAQVPTQTLVVAGDQDSRSASAAELTALLPNGRLVLVPGDHHIVLGAAEFIAAVLDFL